MVRSVWALLACLLLVAASAAQEKDKSARKLSGTFVRDHNGRPVTMIFKDNQLTVKVDDVVVTSVYGLADDILFATITQVEKNNRGPDKRDLFSFKFSLNKDELQVSDLRGTSIDDESKEIVEGTYKKE